jgi:hypothetical protein
MESENKYLQAFKEWFDSLKVVKANKGPANGTLAASLVVLDRLKAAYSLDLSEHVAPRGTQIRGASGGKVTEILKSFGELRPFSKEGGRTNRGGLSEVKSLLDALGKMELDRISIDERNETLHAFQSFIVDRIKDYHNRQKIKFSFDPKLTTWQMIAQLLETAKEEGKAGPVAQHLVGAKLQLRFPDVSIQNESAFTADQQTRRQGDFFLGNTVFHVTVAPMQGVFQKCQENLADGLKVYLLVPDSKLAGARQVAEEFAGKQIAVESLESFISQNLEEASVFTTDRLAAKLSALLQIYNLRVDDVETDKSLMIELPSNLT